MAIQYAWEQYRTSNKRLTKHEEEDGKEARVLLEKHWFDVVEVMIETESEESLRLRIPGERSNTYVYTRNASLPVVEKVPYYSHI